MGRDDRGRLEGHKGSGALSTSCPVGTWAMGGVGWASADYQKDGGPCIAGLLGGHLPLGLSLILPHPVECGGKSMVLGSSGSSVQSCLCLFLAV